MPNSIAHWSTSRERENHIDSSESWPRTVALTDVADAAGDPDVEAPPWKCAALSASCQEVELTWAESSADVSARLGGAVRREATVAKSARTLLILLSTW